MIATLKHNYKGRSGRYRAGDAKKRNTTEEALKYLLDGFTLQEGRVNAAEERRRLAALAQAARAEALARDLAPQAGVGGASGGAGRRARARAA